MASNEEAKQSNDILQEGELLEVELDAVMGGTNKDNLNEINTQDMQALQNAMDKKSKLEKMISNTMKAAGETGGGITSNLKGS